MRIFRISKGNGKFRTIYAPDEALKAKLRNAIPQLVAMVRTHCPPQVPHGFMPARSPITNATAHIGFAYTLTIDLEDFFDTVTWRKLLPFFQPSDIETLTYDGAARQGLPSSPFVANIAASRMDWLLLRALHKYEHNAVYTRYADDLTFSFNTPIADRLLQDVKSVIESEDFRINQRKTKLQNAAGGRRIITGVGVGSTAVYPTRRVKRKLRAARHQNHYGSSMGLAEWCKLKPPKDAELQLRAQIAALQAQLAQLHTPDTVALEERSGRPVRALFL